ncbi:MAG: 3-deoxy-manno-octulosonate cytidylyltransferase [Proteobacteria bacterium]|nr:3-deoxy-manno-octulosonate cytidylyltransferase [Pseudomonadota bacterium]MBI3496432.1 3-deoxy-manno-octulosonate cytidylyltransferase [Pseudomonadota bacterium]
MTLPANPIVLIPSRLHATRLPGKPLADIHGAPMIVHVWRRAVEAGLGPVVVACGEQSIADAIIAAGGQAMLTRPEHPSGSDRIFEVLERLDPGRRHDAVINVQGDLPTVDPATVRAAFAGLAEANVDIGTVAAPITREEELGDPAVVKPVVSFPPRTASGGLRIGRALYFSRATVPTGPGPVYHHIGLYAYRRAALERFVRLPPGALEKRERLEQLRALEAGMQIAVALVDTVPLGVDTPADLERARQLLASSSPRQSR